MGEQEQKYGPEESWAVVVLTPSESKRLLGRAVAQLDVVQRAKERGRVIIAGGTTTAYVAQELLGVELSAGAYTIGWITGGELGSNPEETRSEPPFLLEEGQVRRGDPAEVLSRFTAGDVYIKGGNAVDATGMVGILCGSPTAGNIGMSWPLIRARGAILVTPVGLEKLVPSVRAAAQLPLGNQGLAHCMGMPVGYFPLVGSLVLTEVEAIARLWGCRAVPVAGGGMAGSEGAVVLALGGSPSQVETAFAALQSLKGEPPVCRPEPSS